MLLWIGLLWAGWTLLFLSGDRGVIDSSTGAAANTAQVVYYVAFTIFTLGVGDFVPGGDGWRLLTAVATFPGCSWTPSRSPTSCRWCPRWCSGAPSRCRRTRWGPRPGPLSRGWNGEAFSPAFLQQLITLIGHLATTAEQHLAYPVLRYFHTADRYRAASLVVAALDDAMLVMSAAVAPSARLDDSAVRPVREVISRYVQTATLAGVVTDVDPPPAPDLSPLTAAGVPVVSDTALGAAALEQAERRQALRRLVEADGWSWTS